MLALTIQTAQTIDGHVGQVVLNNEIIFQTKAYKDRKLKNLNDRNSSGAVRARNAAEKHVQDKLRDLLAS